jgi:single-stranded-DNA-specific exonuclease
MKPVLELKNQKVSGYVKTMGKDGGHLKFYIHQPVSGRNIECIGFKLGDYMEDFKTKSFDLAFRRKPLERKCNVLFEYS